jgi:hypothetical protein
MGTPNIPVHRTTNILGEQFTIVILKIIYTAFLFLLFGLFHTLLGSLWESGEIKYISRNSFPANQYLMLACKIRRIK